MTESAAELAMKYRSLIVRWKDARDNPRAANKIFDEHHQLYKSMRETAEGREAILSLLRDEYLPVRVAAAAHCLFISPSDARPVLEAAALGDGKEALSAEYTLRSYDAGKLSFDW